MNPEIRKLIRNMEPKLRKAFLDAIDRVRGSIRIGELERLVASGDVAGIVRYLQIDPSDFGGFAALQQEILNSAGLAYASNIKIRGANVRFGWDMRNPLAQAAAETISSRFITRETEAAKQAVRRYLSEAFSAGRGPRDIALDIAGRVVQGRRQGGVVGLAEHQAQWVSNFRYYLETGNPRALQMTLRDKRFDATIRKGNLTKDQIDKFVARYSDRLLKHRAETIARTEMGFAVEQANQVSFQQAIDKAGVPVEFTYREWIHVPGKDQRDGHADLNRQRRYGNDTFTSVVGKYTAEMLHPHQEGVGAAHVANCRCQVNYGVDYARWHASA